MDATAQFRLALSKRQIIPPTEIIADGKIHRCDAEGKNGHSDASYLLHLDGIPAGGLENHRDGRGWENWRADVDRTLTPKEKQGIRAHIDAQRAEREKNELVLQAKAKRRAAAIWKASTGDVGNHAYLTAKGVGAHKTRLFTEPLIVGGMDCAGSLVVPMRDSAGELRQLQLISPLGEKRFLPGPKPAGSYFAIGKLAQIVCLAEGFATAASIHEATGYAVAVAFHCAGLPKVARVLRDRFPRATIIVCADNDHRTVGNPGITIAAIAAHMVGGCLAVPDFGFDRPEGAKDFNDLGRIHGADAIKCSVDGSVTVVATTTATPATGWGKR